MRNEYFDVIQIAMLCTQLLVSEVGAGCCVLLRSGPVQMNGHPRKSFWSLTAKHFYVLFLTAWRRGINGGCLFSSSLN